MMEAGMLRRRASGLEHFAHQIVDGPGVALEDLLNAACGIDDGGAEVMVDGAFLAPEALAEQIGELGRGDGAAGKETTMLRIGFVAIGLGFEDDRVVEVRM